MTASDVNKKLYVDIQEEYKEAKHRFNEWGPEQRQALTIFAGKVKKYADMIYRDGDVDEKHRLPDLMRQQAIQELKVQSAQSVENRAKRCRIFERTFPDDPNAFIYACVKLSGQPKIILNGDQKAIVIGAYLFADWKAVLPSGQNRRTRERVKVKFINNMFQQLFPDAYHRNRPITQDYLERFIKQEQKKDPVLFKLGREGARDIWAKWMPKLPSTIKAPNECWIADARVLPFYIKHKGKRSTVTLLVIIDAFTGLIIAWHLVVRSVKDETGEQRRVDFTVDDVRLLLLSGMLKHRVRPYIWYTDNGTQFTALEPFLPLLARSEGDEIVTVFGFPGHPWGRGLVEVTLREFDKALLKYAGIVRDEKDREAWRRSRKSANLTIEDLKGVTGAHVQTWNTTGVKGEPTRQWLFDNANPMQLPIPAFDRLLYLGCATEYGSARVTGNGISIPRRGQFKPANLEEYGNWLDAAGQGKVIYAIIPLKQEEHMYACLNGKTWERLITIDADPSSRQTHVDRQWAVLRVRQEQLAEVRQGFVTALERLGREIPKISNDDRALFDEVIADNTATMAEGVTPAEEDKAKVKEKGKKSPQGQSNTEAGKEARLSDELETMKALFAGINIQEKANQLRNKNSS